MDGTKTTTNWIIAGLVALVVIIGGGWLIARERSGTMMGAATTTETGSSIEVSGASEVGSTKPSPTPTPKPKPTPSPSPSPTGTATASGENVTVEDQPAGSSVTVAGVNVSKTSWIAIRDTRGWYPGW